MSKVLGKYVIIDRHDVGKTTEDLLRDLLYESTGARIPGDKIVYGKPRELKQRPTYKYDPNTFIPVIVDIVYDTRFRTTGDGFMYRRRSIIEHCANVDFTSIKPDFFPFRISDILDQINSYLEYPIAMDDLVEYEYSSVEQWSSGVLLMARDDSYLWTDGQTVMIDTSSVNQNNLLTNYTLDGFNIYQPVGGPYTIGGFNEHRGPCGNVDCPICSATGKVVESTSKHIVEYVNMVSREINGAFRKEPLLDNSLTTSIGNVLKIEKVPESQELNISPINKIDERPVPIVDNVRSPYAGITETDDNEEVNLEYYAPQMSNERDCSNIPADSPYHPSNYVDDEDIDYSSNPSSGNCATSTYLDNKVIDSYLSPVKPGETDDCNCL